MEHRKRRRRHEHANEVRFLTFSCIERQPLLQVLDLYAAVIARLQKLRLAGAYLLHGWVAMPDHVHLLLTPALPLWPVSRILSALKTPLAVLARGRLGANCELPIRDGQSRLWQRGGGYDRNVVSLEEFNQKLEYIHANPVRRQLVQNPCDWPWSSAACFDPARHRSAEVDLL